LNRWGNATVRCREIRGWRAWSCLILMAASTIMASGSARAQTAQQLQILQSLSPDEQRQVLEQLGQKGDVTSSNQPVQFPETSQSKSPGDSSGLLVPAEPKFRANDSLIIGIEVVPLPEDAPPRAPSLDPADARACG